MILCKMTIMNQIYNSGITMQVLIPSTNSQTPSKDTLGYDVYSTDNLLFAYRSVPNSGDKKDKKKTFRRRDLHTKITL